MNIKTTFRSLAIISSLTFSLILPTNVFASETPTAKDSMPIALLNDAQIFADFRNEFPAVINYFTSASEKEIILFYQKNYGKIVDSERKRSRLTLKFSHQTHNIRIVISKQNRKNQVDVLVQKQ